MFVHGYAHAEVAGGQDVRAPERKHQEHLRGPDTNAFDLGEVRDDFGIGQFLEAGEIQIAGGGFGGEIFQVGRFLLGEASGAHLSVGEFENAFRREWIAGECREAFENRRRSSAVELLVDDGFGEAFELGRAVGYAAGADALDNGAQRWVGLLQVEDGFAHRLHLT